MHPFSCNLTLWSFIFKCAQIFQLLQNSTSYCGLNLSVCLGKEIVYQVCIKDTGLKQIGRVFSLQIFRPQYAKQALNEGKNHMWYGCLPSFIFKFTFTLSLSHTHTHQKANNGYFRDFPLSSFLHFLIHLTKNSSRKRN